MAPPVASGSGPSKAGANKPSPLELKLHKAGMAAPNHTISQADLLKVTGLTVNATTQDAVNALLRKNLCTLLRTANGENVMKFADKNEAKTMGAMDAEEKLVLDRIKDAGNEGIWTKDITTRTGLLRTTINKCLKSLEQKKQIKSVKNVKYPTRRFYMLAGLVPSVDISGGPWFTDNELDTEFVSQLKRIIVKFLKDKAPNASDSNLLLATSVTPYLPTVSDIRKWIAAAVVSVELHDEHVESLLDLMVFEGLLEKIMVSGVQRASEKKKRSKGDDSSDSDADEKRPKKKLKKPSRSVPVKSSSKSKKAKEKTKSKRFKVAAADDDDSSEEESDFDSDEDAETAKARKKSKEKAKKKKNKKPKGEDSDEEDSDEKSEEEDNDDGGAKSKRRRKKRRGKKPLSDASDSDTSDSSDPDADTNDRGEPLEAPSLNDYVYKVVTVKPQKVGWTEMPCGRCPSQSFCAEARKPTPKLPQFQRSTKIVSGMMQGVGMIGGAGAAIGNLGERWGEVRGGAVGGSVAPVNPRECVYFKEWLDF